MDRLQEPGGQKLIDQEWNKRGFARAPIFDETVAPVSPTLKPAISVNEVLPASSPEFEELYR